MHNGRAVGAWGMKTEHLEGWLRGVVAEDEEGTGREGAGTLWCVFVDLVQMVWETGTIPQQMLWVVVVFIPKGTATTVASGCLT